MVSVGPAATDRATVAHESGIGVTVDSDGVRAAVIDSEGRIRYSHSADELVAEDTLEATVRTIRRLVDACLSAADELDVTPAGVGISLPGRTTLDGAIVNAPRIGWADVAVGSLLPALADFRVVVVDEADAGATAEARDLADDFVYVSGTPSGIGGSLVLGGRLHGGAPGRAPDIGHIVVDPSGPACTCGASGCLTQLAGLSRITRTALRDVTTVPANKRLAAVLERLEEGDRRAVQAVSEAGVHLGTALATIVKVVAPAMVRIGGPYTRLMPWLEPTVRAALRGHAPETPLLAPGGITNARAGEDGSLIGAVMLAVHDPAAGARPTPAPR